jgi:hypothetical protein
MSNLLIMTSDQYHADPAPQASLSASIAKILIEQSPLHAMMAHPRLNPNYEPEEDSRFDLGSAAHAMLLERDATKILWVEADDWRTKVAKEIREAARACKLLPVLAKYQPALKAMVSKAQACVADSELAGIFDHGMPERTILWKEENGVFCRARLDLTDMHVVLDYKSTENAEPEAFIRQIGRMAYDVQAEFYTRGMANIGEDTRFVFLAQEITPPYACSLIALSNAYREIGQMKVERAIRVWGECMAAQKWPGYPMQIHYAEPSAWQLNEMAGYSEEAA